MTGRAGVTATACRAGTAVTVKVTDALTPAWVAVMIVLPGCQPFAIPVLPIVAVR